MSFSQMDENKRSPLRFERSENSNLEVRNLEVRFQLSTMQTQIGVLGRTKASVRGEAKRGTGSCANERPDTTTKCPPHRLQLPDILTQYLSQTLVLATLFVQREKAACGIRRTQKLGENNRWPIHTTVPKINQAVKTDEVLMDKCIPGKLAGFQLSALFLSITVSV